MIMKRVLNFKTLCAALALFFAIGSTDVIAKKKPVLKRKAVTTKRVAPAPLYTVTSGTVMRVRRNQTISLNTPVVGKLFTGTVREPVYSTNGVVVIPSVSNVSGGVDAVVPARKGGMVGTIDISCTR